MRRFFIDGPLGDEIIITGQDARHIGRVLRLAPGDELVVAGADGRTGRAVITAVGLTCVTARLEEVLDAAHEPPISVRLAQGLPKGDKLEYIIQKAAELGVAGVIPVAADNCVVRYDGTRQACRQDRWRKIAAEAAKQCGRSAVPAVDRIMTLAEALGTAGSKETIIMLYEGGGDSLRDILAAGEARDYLLLVGPEGGFSPAEAALARSSGARFATLGPRILRTETASLAALAIVMYEKGDLGG